MDGGPQRERRSDGTSRRSVRRLRCLDRSVERYVNASSSAVGTSGTYDLLRCPHVDWRPVDSVYLVILLYVFTHVNSKDSASIR